MKRGVKGITVYCDVRGTGRPLIVLHGLSLDHRVMEAGLEPIFRKRKRWRRIYIDMPCHGKTPVPDWIMKK